MISQQNSLCAQLMTSNDITRPVWCHCAGVERWCFKRLSANTGDAKEQVEIDGAAHSETDIVLVERKPSITLEDVRSFKTKIATFRCVWCVWC